MQQKIFNVLFISIFAAMLGFGIIAPLMPIYAESLGASGIWLGIIFAGFSLARGIFMPLFGRISDKKGRKKFIITGLFLYVIISLAYPLADNVLSLTIIRFIHGFASAMIVPIAMAYIGETREKGEEGVAMGTFNIALFSGMGAGPLLGGFLNDTFGFASAFYVMAGLAAAAFLITLFLLPEKIQERKRESQTPFREIIENKLLRGLLFFRFISAMGNGAIMVFLPIYASKININSWQVGILLSTNILLTALFLPFFGKLADRRSKFYLILIGASIGAIALLFIPLTTNFSQLFFVSFLMGVGGAIAIPSAMAITVLAGRKVGMGASFGLFDTVMSFGMMSAPLISGLVMDLWNIEFVFLVSGLIALLGVAVFYYSARNQRI